jgi:hypothetical protein
MKQKYIKHQPLVFFSLKLVIAGFKDYQIKYTILVLKPKQIKQQQMKYRKVMKDFIPFIINPEKLIILK